MKRYFYLHDKKRAVAIDVLEGSEAEKGNIKLFKEVLQSDNIEEITLQKYYELSAIK